MRLLKELIDNNREWAAGVTARDPSFFKNLAEQQTPKYLWIGCSDSRVPANQITGIPPGGIFVHRNVANIVVHTDLNCLSVMQFAVDVLKVKHIIVCGHYGCGGVRAAWQNQNLGLISNWLRHVQDVGHKHRALIDSIEGDDAKCERLCELNVIEQAINVSQTTIVQAAWERGQELAVHSWIYGLADGLIKDLKMCVSAPSELARTYNAALESLCTKSSK
ncbi:MAG: carbonate dehydratase [Deltaproteobacteria bacterium]|nr:carbonate dehydratase [Deltaproteobacteria bacterium]